MKKIFTLCTVIILLFSSKAFAKPITSVDFSGTQKLKAGEKANILVNVKDASGLYALQLDYSYNAEDIKVLGLYKGEMLANANYGFIDSSGQPVGVGIPARYYLTFTGENTGVQGNGEVVKIEIEALRDCDIQLNKENMKIILVGIDKNFEVFESSYNLVQTDGEVVKIEGDINNPMNESSENKNSSVIWLVLTGIICVAGAAYVVKKRKRKDEKSYEIIETEIKNNNDI